MGLFTISLLLAFSNSILTFGLTLFPILMVVLYTLGLKKILIVKDVVVALGWSATILIVASYAEVKNIEVLLLVYIFIFLRVLITTVVFDIKDVEGDRVYGIKTIPAYFGFAMTKRVVYLLNTISIPVMAYGLLLSPYFIIFAFNVVYCYLYTYLIGHPINKNNLVFYDLMVDGEYILMGFTSLIVKYAIGF
jgi:4-hydroxybenzoate polyprenyltransferase